MSSAEDELKKLEEISERVRGFSVGPAVGGWSVTEESAPRKEPVNEYPWVIQGDARHLYSEVVKSQIAKGLAMKEAIAAGEYAYSQAMRFWTGENNE